MMATSSAVLGGIVLMAVGLYQWTPLKETCLRSCQAPLAFLMSHGGFRNKPLGALRLGMAHGGYCPGCCFPLITLLFVRGIINVPWVAGPTILRLFRKIVPARRLIPRGSRPPLGPAAIWL